MSLSHRLLLVCALILVAIGSQPRIDKAANRPTPVADTAPSLRFPFIANHGQTHSSVRYYVPSPQGSMFVTDTGAMVYRVSPRSPIGSSDVTISEELAGARPPVVEGESPAPTTVNIFHGNDPSQWRRGIPTYHAVRMGEVFDGVELTLRASASGVEKVFTVEPGADPTAVRLRITPATELGVTAAGELEARTGAGPVRFSRPVAYQERAGAREPVDVAYSVDGNEYGFDLGAYDRSRPLVIDPYLVATYLGGTGDGDVVFDLLLDGLGNLYATGWTNSIDFPGIGPTSPDQTVEGCHYYEGFVAKLDPGLGVIHTATFLGGTGMKTAEGARALARTLNGDIYVAGHTVSSDFPGLSPSSFDSSFAGSHEGFVVRLDANLTNILGSTLLGGNGIDLIHDAAIDPVYGSIYLVGETTSTDFPGVSCGSLSADCSPENREGFVTILDPTLNAFVGGTYIGGPGGIGKQQETVHSIAIDPAGNIIVGGVIATGNLFFATGADSTYGGKSEAYVVKLTIGVDTVLGATYLGGSDNDDLRAVALVPAGNDYTVVAVGATCSADFTGVTAASADSDFGNAYSSTPVCEGFVTKLTSDLFAIVGSSYIGGDWSEHVLSVAAAPDGSGNVYVGGTTESPGFPGVDGFSADATFFEREGFITKFNADLTQVIRSTYLGGKALDAVGYGLTFDPSGGPSGDLFVSGYTYGTFPGVDATAADTTQDSSEGVIVRLWPLLEKPFVLKFTAIMEALLEYLAHWRGAAEVSDQLEMIATLGQRSDYQGAIDQTRNLQQTVDRLVADRVITPEAGRELQALMTELIADLEQADREEEPSRPGGGRRKDPLETLPSCPIPPVPTGRR